MSIIEFLILNGSHLEFLKLGKNTKQRQENYREMFKSHSEKAVNDEIRWSLNKGLALGSDLFKEEVEQLCGQRVTEGKRGRPHGWRKEVDR